MGAYLQLQWLTHRVALTTLDCFVEAGVLAVLVAQVKGCLIIQQYMYSNFQLDKIFVLNIFMGTHKNLFKQTFNT